MVALSVIAATTTTTEPRRDDDRVEDEELHEIHDQALWHLDIAEAKRRDAEAVRVKADRVKSGEQLASVRASVDDDDDAEAASVETDDSEVGVKLTFREAAVDDGSPHAQAALLRRQSDALRAAAKVYESDAKQQSTFHCQATCMHRGVDARVPARRIAVDGCTARRRWRGRCARR